MSFTLVKGKREMMILFLIFAVMLQSSFAVDVKKTQQQQQQQSPFSQKVRFDSAIIQTTFTGGLKALFDGFANIVSDSFRYYLANPYRKFIGANSYPEPSVRTMNSTPTVYYSCNVTNDPFPTGGAPCTNDLACNSVNKGGVCNFNSGNAEGTIGACICANGWGNPNCTYQRISKDLVGGLQIGLVFAGVGGVGNFILGRSGIAVGQLILMLGYYLCCISLCLFCCELYVPGTILIIIAIAAYLSGFIWAIVDGAYMLQCMIPDAAGYALY
jgi:hypothetical protein